MRRSRLFLLVVPLFVTTSCAMKTATECKPIIEKVPVKCTAPDVPIYKLENIGESDTYEERLRKLISNYGKLKEENKLLRESLKVCQ